MLKNIDDQTTTVAIILLVSFISVAEGGRLRCLPEQFAERNESFVVACNATETVIDVYWFKGADTSNYPILTYENGEQGGTEFQKGEYELAGNFNLKIINAQKKHEMDYTVRVYFHEHDYETETSDVRIYDPPITPCPYVDACGVSCDGCAINVNTSGYLVCYVNGSRSDLDIDWNVEEPFGISYAKQGQLKRHNETTKTWHIERIISYNVDRCGANATVHCLVDSSISFISKIYENYTISVQVRSAKCETPFSAHAPKNGDITHTIIFVAAGAAAAVLIFLMCLLIRKYRKDIKPKGRDEKKRILISNLETVYKERCFVKPLPWGEPIPITALYTAPYCTVAGANGDISHKTSSDLLKMDFISDNPRILLVADLGHGKTSFTKYFVKEWITSQRKENDQTGMNGIILIHVHLKDVRGDELLSDIVRDMLPVGHKLTSKDIEEIFHTYDCIVVFDGLDEMSISARKILEEQCQFHVVNETVTLSIERDQSKLSIVNVLRNTIHSSRYQKLKVWVTSRDIDYMNSVFALPYSKIAFRFSKDDAEKYINVTCKYYLGLCERVSELESVKMEVNKLINVNEIVENFCKTPLLLMMIIHIVTSRLVSDDKKYEKVNLNKLTTLMKLVIWCLESRYIDKLPKHPKVTRQIKEIKTKLGKLAFENQGKISREFWGQRLGKDFTTALKIGLLKYADKVDLEGSTGTDLRQSSFSGIVFYHEYFKEYLAALYILESNQEWKRLNEYIEMSSDEGTVRLLQFMCGLDHPESHNLFKILLQKQHMWNNLIDCMYEVNDRSLKKSILEDFKKAHSSWTTIPIIKIKYLKKKYHKEALADFCKVCGDHDIKLRLEFQEKCALSFIDETKLPPLMSLVFRNMSFNEKEYVSVINNLTSKRYPDTLRFVNCKVPKKLSEANGEKELLKGKGMKICHFEEVSKLQSLRNSKLSSAIGTSFMV